MADSKKKDAKIPAGIRTPKPQQANSLGLKIRMPHVDLIRPRAELETRILARTEVDHRSAGELSSPVELSSPAEQSSPAEHSPETPPIGVQIEHSSRTELSSPIELSSVLELSSSEVTVPWKDGYLKVPNYILDSLLPLLSQDEAGVYLRLYRLASIKVTGRARGWCLVSAPNLIEKTGIKRTRLFAALAGLESKGLIQRDTREVKRGKGSGRGTVGTKWSVFEPEISGRPPTDLKSEGELRSRRELSSEGELGSAGGHHEKKNERKGMKGVSGFDVGEQIEPPSPKIVKAWAFEFARRNPEAEEEALLAHCIQVGSSHGLSEAQIRAALDA